MSKDTTRLSLDLSNTEFNQIKELIKESGKTQTKAEVVRKGLRLLAALQKGELFLSNDPKTTGKIPLSIL